MIRDRKDNAIEVLAVELWNEHAARIAPYIEADGTAPVFNRDWSAQDTDTHARFRARAALLSHDQDPAVSRAMLAYAQAAATPQPGEVWLVTMPWWPPAETATAVFKVHGKRGIFDDWQTLGEFYGPHGAMSSAIPLRKLGHDCNA